MVIIHYIVSYGSLVYFNESEGLVLALLEVIQCRTPDEMNFTTSSHSTSGWVIVLFRICTAVLHVLAT